MKLRTLARGMTGVVMLAALVSAGTAQAATTTTCTQPMLYQPFLPFLDGNWYSPAPGESYDNFDAGSWTLSGGAKTTSTTLKDGTTGLVLTLPKGAKAVSPPLCVNNTYPYMRTMENAANGGQLTFAISYLQTSGAWKAAQSIGTITPATAWSLSAQLKLAAGPYTGWNYAVLTITGAGSKTTSTSSLYNLYFDPRMQH